MDEDFSDLLHKPVPCQEQPFFNSLKQKGGVVYPVRERSASACSCYRKNGV